MVSQLQIGGEILSSAWKYGLLGILCFGGMFSAETAQCSAWDEAPGHGQILITSSFLMVWIATRTTWLDPLLPRSVLAVGLLNLTLGNACLICLSMLAAAKRKQCWLVP